MAKPISATFQQYETLARQLRNKWFSSLQAIDKPRQLRINLPTTVTLPNTTISYDSVTISSVLHQTQVVFRLGVLTTVTTAQFNDMHGVACIIRHADAFENACQKILDDDRDARLREERILMSDIELYEEQAAWILRDQISPE